MQEAVIPRWANGAAGVLYAAAAASLLVSRGEASWSWVSSIAALVSAGVAILMGWAAATGRGRLARRNDLGPAQARSIAILSAAMGFLVLSTYITLDFKLRDMGVVFVMFGTAVVHSGWAAATRKRTRSA